MAVTKLCTYIETLFTDVGYIFTNVSNGCDKNWIRELVKMSQTLLMFSLMLQPLLIQYVSNGCDKIAVKQTSKFETFVQSQECGLTLSGGPGPWCKVQHTEVSQNASRVWLLVKHGIY